MPSRPTQPCARVVVLGASNASNGISLIVETAERMIGAPLDVHAAIGHGRSYGQRSFLIARSIQGSLDCGLWDAIDADEARDIPLYALLTDVGNDIMYCVEPERIIAWVGECIDRLQSHDAKIVLTGLPIPILRRISSAHYLFFRTIFFPTNRLPLDEAVQRAQTVHDGLRKLAQACGVPFVEQREEWYGIDPIHIAQSPRAGVWRDVLSQWFDAPPENAPIATGSVRRFLTIRTRLPEHWWLFNRLDLGGRQPCAVLPTGTRVSLY